MGEMKIRDGKINFRCKMNYCQHSCCGPFSGVTQELSSIDKRPFEEIVLTPEDYDMLYANGYANLIEEGYSEGMQKKYYKMALEADGTCKAFRNGRCSIYGCSPTLCRAFPFYFDMFSGLCAIQCEGFSDEHWSDVADYSEYFAYARRMYEFWLDFYSPKPKSE